MPFKSKEDYNRYLKDYMAKRRAVKPIKPVLNPSQPSVKPKSDALRDDSSTPKDISNSVAPPELDASGEIVPEYW